MARPRPATAPSRRGADDLLSKPPSTAMFLAGLSAYPYEQYQQVRAPFLSAALLNAQNKASSSMPPCAPVPLNCSQRQRTSMGRNNVFMTTTTQAGMDNSRAVPKTIAHRAPESATAAAAAEEDAVRALKAGASPRTPPMPTEVAVSSVYGDAPPLRVPDFPSTPMSSYDRMAASAGIAAPEREYRPRFVTHDGEVLRFFAYYKEKVPASAVESWRVRCVEVLLYLVDGTLQLNEPRGENTGLPQGTVLNRQLAFKDDTMEQIRPRDLVVGSEVTLFGITYHVVDADPRTRRHMSDAYGVDMTAPQPVPKTPYVPPPIGMEHTPRPTKVACDVGDEEDQELGFYHRKADTLHQFLENDRRVLSFAVVWDDTERMYGERRTFQLNHYLADNTTELLERNAPNSGRDAFPRLVNRMKIELQAKTLPPGVDQSTLAAEAAVEQEAERRAAEKAAEAAAEKAAAERAAASDAAAAAQGGVSYAARQRSMAPPTPPRHPLDYRDTGRGITHPITDRPTFERPGDLPRPPKALTPPTPGSRAPWAHQRPDRVSAGVGVVASGASVGNSGGVARASARPPPKHLMPRDLRVGGTITLFGRVLHVRSCDEFTRRWYLDNLGIDQAGTQAAGRGGSGAAADGEDAASGGVDWTNRSVSLEDILKQLGVPGLAPAPIHTVGTTKGLDLQKFSDYHGKVLRFMGRLVSSSPIEAARRFIVQYFLVDDTLSVFEPFVPNSGVMSGKFLERGQYRNARGEEEDVVEHDGVHKRPRHFAPQDFGVGRVIEFEHARGQQFELFEADAFTNAYLAKVHADEAAADAGATGGAGGSGYARMRSALEAVAWRLAGRVASFGKQVEAFDARGTGEIERYVVEGMLRRAGASPPQVPEEAFKLALSQFESGGGVTFRYREFVRALRQCRVQMPVRPRTAGEAETVSRGPTAATRDAAASALPPKAAAAAVPPKAAVEDDTAAVMRILRASGVGAEELTAAFARSEGDALGRTNGIVDERTFFAALRRARASVSGSDAELLKKVLFPSPASCIHYGQFLRAVFP